MKPKNLGIALLLVALSSLALVAWHYRAWFHSLTPGSLRACLVHWGFWKGAILFFAIYSFSIRPFVPTPPTLYTITGGLAFGHLWGALLTIFGSCGGVPKGIAKSDLPWRAAPFRPRFCGVL